MDGSTPHVVGSAYNSHQIEQLAARAITERAARDAGVISVQSDADLAAVRAAHPDTVLPAYWSEEGGYLPGLLFPIRSPTPGVALQWQLKPDTPWIDADGDPHKYLFPLGFSPVLNAIKTVPGALRSLLVEGTCQAIVAGLYAPDGVNVYGISGCWSWQSGGSPTIDLLALATVKDAVIVLDADAATNLQVYSAGLAFGEELETYGVESVKFGQVNGRGNDGLDDVVAKRPEQVRHALLEKLISKAISKPAAKKPSLTEQARREAAKRREERAAAPGGEFFTEQGGLLVKTLSEFIRRDHPAALSAEYKVAMYADGVYGIDGVSFLSEITRLLGERFLKSHHTNAEAFTVGELAGERAFLPDRIDRPLLNLRNGMLDLTTGQLLDHNPSFMSTAQFAVDWDPDAKAPAYEQWLSAAIGTQVADLEEATSAVLDPSATPTKALFLFGPSRSGKSTYLRLLKALVGGSNTAGVSLHQLVENRFMAANVYGKVLNISADLSARHVEDISIFKLLTGEDLIQADRKFGGQFSFTNRALFAFSANELPTIGEGSRAYSERIKPFEFGNTFAGHEDPTIEAALLTELPGILVRLVTAWQARKARGSALTTDPSVREKFEIASDRVRQFVAARYRIGTGFSTTTEVYNAFKNWASEEGRAGMGRNRVAARLFTIPGVKEERGPARSRGWNLELLPENEWGEGETARIEVKAGSFDLARKPDIEHELEDKVDKTDTERAVRAVSPPLRPDAIFSKNENTKSEKITYTHSRKKVPELPAPDSDKYLIDHSLNRYVSVCDRGHEEVLIDGLWFACPVCNPATVANNDRMK